jgi:quercetin dioxygenase-like cupin family protein
MNASNLRALAAIVLFVAVQEVSVARARVASGAAQPEAREKGRLVLTHTLPRLDGNYLKATVVQVHYGPDELSPQHSHPCSVSSYVVQGTYRTQEEGDPEAVYKVGQALYEAPNSHHVVSANAGKTEPTRFIAFFICDQDSPLTTNIQGSVDGKRLSQ